MRTRGRDSERTAGRRQAFIVVVLAAAATAPSIWAEPWKVTGSDPAKIAVVEGSSGSAFSVSSGPNRSALCEFRLAADAPSPKEDALPTFVVDDGDPTGVLRRPRPVAVEEPQAEKARKAEKAFEKNWIGDGGDLLQLAIRSWDGLPLVAAESDSVRFECWTPLRGQESPTRGLLRQVLDGEQLIVRYETEAGETRDSFSLEGAREAILEATGLSAEPSSRDLVLEDLLEFRVHYRRTTCYLLGTRKRALGCLELVNECAQKPHDSVLSMQECIDGR